jgi:hypothetical protein
MYHRWLNGKIKHLEIVFPKSLAALESFRPELGTQDNAPGAPFVGSD